MGTIFEAGTDNVTVDESAGLQTSGIPDADTGEDNDDNDILLSAITSLLESLADLNAPVSAISAARNQVLTFAPDANLTLSFSLKDGDDNVVSTLTTTAGDDPITLVRINATTIFGYANYEGAGERVAFALVLEETSGGAQITIVQYEAIHHPIGGGSYDEAVDLAGLVFVDAAQDVAFNDFSDAPSGQNLWISVTDPVSDTQILVTGLKLGVDTVNTSTAALGSNSQSIVIDDGLVFDFVRGQTAPNQTTADDIANIDFDQRVEGSSGGFTLVQTGANASNRVGAKVTAYNSSEVGSDFSDGSIGGATQTIVAIEVWDGSGNLVSSWDGTTTTGTDADVSFTRDGESVTIEGLLVNYRVEFHVGVVDGDDTGTLDRFSVQNASAGGASNDTFDLGNIRLGAQLGDQADVGNHIRFEDDGPSVDAALGAGAVSHDETAGVDLDADDTTAPAVAALFSGVLTLSGDMTAAFAQGDAAVLDASLGSYGQDEEGATTAYSLDVSAAGVDSGLDTTDGHSILLYEENGLVVGRISGGADDGKAAFAVTIDANTGVLSLAQYASIWHPTPGASHDESLSIANGALLATVTVTDGDDDVASDSVAIGAQVSFQDDGPSVDAVLGAGAVSHDETAGVDLDADDTTAPAVAALFSGVLTLSGDMTAAFAQGDAAVLDASLGSYGQDEEGATTAYSLDVSAAGVDSGLDTTDGHSILLYEENGLVVGRISGGADDGKAAFAVTIDADTGVLSLAQYASIWHPTPGASHDESLGIANGALLATVTVTDGDGDVATDSVAIGAQVSFQDDGPSADAALGAGAVSHDETAGVDLDADDTTAPAVAALFSGVLTLSTDMTAAFAQGAAAVLDASLASYGQDEEGATTAYSLDVSAAGVDSGLDTTDGHSILLYEENGLVVGRISGGDDDGKAAFAVTIDADTGVLSLAQYASIWHEDETDHDDTMTIAGAALLATVTVTDGDGDVASDSLAIGARVAFEDDGPLAIDPEHGEVANAAGAAVFFTLDEDLVPLSFADNFGQDGPGADGGVVFAGSIGDDGTPLTNTDGVPLTSGGVGITLFGFGGNTLTAYAGSDTTAPKVFTITLDGSSGQYSVDMDATIDSGSISFDNFGTTRAGHRYWLGVAGDEDPSKDLLVTGGNPLKNAVNSDSDDIAIGNQWIDQNEVVRLDFVNSITTTKGSSNLNDIPQPAEHYLANDVGFTVMQTKAKSLVDVRIAAIDAERHIDGSDGTSIASDLQAGSLDEITSVTVIDGTTGVSSTYTSSVESVVTFNDDGSVIVYSLNAPTSSTRDQVFVSTADGFSRLEVSNVDANKQHDFAIGSFDLGVEEGTPVDLAFDVNVVDGDGDVAVGLIGLTLTPESLI